MPWNEILYAILMLSLCLVLFYVVMRFFGNKLTYGKGLGNMEVIDRIIIEREKSIVIVKVQERYFLLGVANSTITKLEELSDFEPAEAPPVNNDFAGILTENINKLLHKKDHTNES